MLRALTLISLLSFVPLLKAQTVDTLSNLPEGTSLYAPRYTNTGQWGYVLGQNSSYRQQFAEKYYIDGQANVTSLITHLTGVVNNEDNYVEFNVYQVGENGLPSNRLGGKQVLYKNLDLSGEAMKVSFNTPIAVQDSFFVTFNVLDYLHGGFDGDTLGLMMGEDGSRSTEDLGNFGRNAIQAHNHTKEDWKDFYTQNFTPIATHFALFPIVEAEGITALASAESETRATLFPNPATDRFHLGLEVDCERMTVFDLMGEVVFEAEGAEIQNGVDVSEWPSGSYLIRLAMSDKGFVVERLVVGR